MPAAPQPLDSNQQKLVNIVKATHQNLALARKTRVAEIQRRLHEKRIEINRLLDNAEHQVTMDINHEIAVHEAALDEALIAAYNAGIPVTRIALDGFGNRYPGTTTQLLNKLRAEGLIGSRDDYQRKGVSDPITVAFPEPIDASAVISEATTIANATYSALPDLLRLVPDTDEFDVPAVLLTMDARDPYFKSISDNARPGTPYRYATTATLYLRPHDGSIAAFESDEKGTTFWDHPVARWVKDHPETARAGYDAALSA